MDSQRYAPSSTREIPHTFSLLYYNVLLSVSSTRIGGAVKLFCVSYKISEGTISPYHLPRFVN